MKNIEIEIQNSIHTAFAVIISSKTSVIAWERICLITKKKTIKSVILTL